MKSLFFCFILSIVSVSLFAQAGRDEALAASYLQNGEYDKAAELYKTLWDKNDNAVRCV